jgi:hypothetical protein
MLSYILLAVVGYLLVGAGCFLGTEVQSLAVQRELPGVEFETHGTVWKYLLMNMLMWPMAVFVLITDAP